jgi:Zn-dependent protease with chaperone function
VIRRPALAISGPALDRVFRPLAGLMIAAALVCAAHASPAQEDGFRPPSAHRAAPAPRRQDGAPDRDLLTAPLRSDEPIPAAFRPHVPRRALTYQRTARALGLAGRVWNLIGIWLLLRTGLSARLRDLSLRLARSNPDPPPTLLATALFYAAYAGIIALWSAPFALAGFALERKFGFSTQSPGSLLSDACLDYLFSLVMIPVVWAGYRLYSRTRRWWLWLWALTAILLLFGIVLQPVLIAPRYNSYTPLPPGQLRTDILALAGKAGISGARVFVKSTSLRSTHVNAYVAGIGPTTRIVINDTALRLLPEDQILAMVGHEMGHYVEGHVWIKLSGGVLGAFVFLLLAAGLLPSLAERMKSRWRLRGVADLAALPMVFLVMSLFLLIQDPIDSALSRALEHRADAFGLRVSQRPLAMARLFDGFAERDFQDPDPPALLQFWFGTHPTLDERIRFALEQARGMRDNE